MFSSAHVNAALTGTMKDQLLNKIKLAGKEDEKWPQEQGRELVRMRESGWKMPDEWMDKEGLLDYKNQLYIHENESLKIAIAQGCHDSLVAGHFRQRKTIAIVTKDF